MWKTFLVHFNGRAFWQEDLILDKDFCLSTDSAGSVGFIAVWDDMWCSSTWPASWVSKGLCKNIVLLELSLEIWGDRFANKRILFSTDNKGVLFAVNCLSLKSPPVISLLRYFVFKCLCLNIWIKAKYVPGKVNEIADSLSRLQMERFFSLLPTADLVGTPCPSHLWDII